MGVPRVNGQLSMTRAFGNGVHKRTGGPDPRDRPVTALPQLQDFELGANEFLILGCDGISEGSFPNADVVQFAANRLQTSDPAQVACDICHEAINKGSKDNVSCIIVLPSHGGAGASTGCDHAGG
ncbi:unnamed protein product [Symbiodinium pilosum]|uniref:protein-serine/threonine phosphatase n=1 Tax=Symbiodinium pilosum TaxID=2952 RepID=A0A812LQS4_SYMPI|nr:unnamed protein product [Symbiodinium pilosum]